MYLNTEWFLLFPHFLLLASFTALHRLSLWVFATALLKLLAASIFELILFFCVSNYVNALWFSTFFFPERVYNN